MADVEVDPDENPYSRATLALKLDGQSWESCAEALREELERVEAMADDP